MNIRAVLFDLDGTLLDRQTSLRNFVRWQVNGMLREQIKHTEYFVQRFIELDANGSVWKDQVYEILVDEFSIRGWTAKELLTSYELCFCAFCTAKTGARHAVRKLAEAGIKLAIISNGTSPFQERNFSALGMTAFFEAVLVSEAVGLRKPDARFFYLACEKLRTDFQQCVVVGDSPIADIEGANQAGIRSVYVPGFYGDECSEATAVCRNLSELPDILLRLS